jgi:hypothetical protein
VHALVGNPMPHSGPIVINLILSPMTPSAPFTPFLRLRCGSYNLKFVRTPKLEGEFDPGPTFQKNPRASESRSTYPSPACPWPRLGGSCSDIVRNVDLETIDIANYLRLI